ncbi:putative helix-loop-helix DNA-binding domain superfamily [Helianthus annuus]|uniref:Helix-loop-helix DNA-binding domain superfamily n=1 Tax=Helianthus annuus TaxID=4232 RepID=A0A9K3J4K3_HELAN|nr:putative helix-loop-helix DNA-binding domain superfamily [Helianthus annuus]
MVPNISKMDKASIVKDMNDYIQLLRGQERTIQAESTKNRVDMRGSSI